MGGYIAGTKTLRDYLVQTARPLLFSTAHPPAVVEASRAAIRVLSREPDRVERLWENTRYFKRGLDDLGLDTGRSETPITPVLMGEAEHAHALSDGLRKRGVFVQSVVFPTVPQGAARVRAMVSASHTREDLDQAIEAFREVTQDMQNGST